MTAISLTLKRNEKKIKSKYYVNMEYLHRYKRDAEETRDHSRMIISYYQR